MNTGTFIIGSDERIVVTGAAGFIGCRLVRQLIEYGFTNLRCLVRPSASSDRINALRECGDGTKVEVMYGNLLSRADCVAACENAAVVFHLAAGRGEKSYSDAFLNS